jgi:hypothetical protein
MIFAPRYSRHERALMTRLWKLGVRDESTSAARPEFRAELRRRLVAAA